MNYLESFRPSKVTDLVLSQLFLVLVPCTLLCVGILLLTHGHFTYSLDDPYIHLTLARSIAEGSYGINIGEPSAPSSSIIWPVLLAPFSLFTAYFEYVPLIINILALSGVVLVLRKYFADIGFFQRNALIFILLLSLNVYGLVFTGMEHSLQVFLVALALLPFLTRKEGAAVRLPAYAAVALILLPLVRYEDMAISLPVLTYCLFSGERRKALLLLAVIGAVVIGFSLYLHANGLGFLPSSIMAKSSLGGVHATLQNLQSNISFYGFMLFVSGVLASAYWRQDKGWACVILSVTALHFLFGRHGWFGRYEVYYLLFISLTALRLAIDRGYALFPVMLLVPFAFSTLIPPTLKTPWASASIYNQQAQMAGIARALGEPVAVNDLGLVSLRSGRYVLDLWGLGSREALQARLSHTDSHWIIDLMHAKNVHYAFIYDGSFPDKPAELLKVGELKLLLKGSLTPFDSVALYATDADAAAKLKATLSSFSSTHTSNNFRIDLL